MIRLLSKYRIYSGFCEHIKTDQADLVIAFKRQELLFVFNFHPSSSFTDYGLAVDAGKYSTVLCSDDPEFGGFDRYDSKIVHRTQVEPSFGLKQNLKLYLPSRTALVLKRSEIPKVR
jgi:1,4-alpha-glucan branching enzyme